MIMIIIIINIINTIIIIVVFIIMKGKTIEVHCLNRNRALAVPDTAPNGIEFGAVKARCLN